MKDIFGGFHATPDPPSPIPTSVVVRFERALLDALLPAPGGEERFELPERCLPWLVSVLERAAVAPNADREIERALRLVVALDGSLKSPTAAERLRSVLRSVPAVKAHLRAKRRKRGGIDATRGFLAREGRAVALKAPRVAPRRTDSLTIADFHRTSAGRKRA